MSVHKSPLVIGPLTRVLNTSCLLLILATLLYLCLQTAGVLRQSLPAYHRDVVVLFLLTAILVLLAVPGQFLRAARERQPQRQEPGACTMDSSPAEFRFSCPGLAHDLVPRWVAFLEFHFSHHVMFHSFDAPHLSFVYLAKTGTASLFAFPWIRTGAGVFLLTCCLHLSRPGWVPAPIGALLFLILIPGSCITGCWLVWFRPYQKLWLLLLEQTGAVQVTLIWGSPFPASKRGRLTRALEQVLEQQDVPPTLAFPLEHG